jgi:TonB-dependent SusC/RagA subfamily outer membrane receptor
MLRLKILLLFLFIGSQLSAQIEISGTVTDAETNEPLIGTNVVIFGTTTGVTTDLNGKYTIKVGDNSDSLQFSYTGYSSQIIAVGEKRVINVMMTSGQLLDEVVVVGYGKQSKVKLTSAISTVDNKTLKKLPTPNVSNGLEGLASGLFVRQGSGEPGFSGSSFEIRNFGNALVIVDGSPGNIDDLDPNEIESISILKDAAAASVYGVQGGNGVVLVTTRKGGLSKPELNYSNQFTNTAFTAYPDFLNSIQYATVLNEGLINAGLTRFYTPEQIALFESGEDPINYPNENRKALMFKDWGFQ